jgi:hypothetical protein
MCITISLKELLVAMCPLLPFAVFLWGLDYTEGKILPGQKIMFAS